MQQEHSRDGIPSEARHWPDRIAALIACIFGRALVLVRPEAGNEQGVVPYALERAQNW